MWAQGPTDRIKQYVFGYFDDNLWVNEAGHNVTEDEIWTIFTWSLHYSYLAVWPRIQWTREPWPPDSSEGRLASSGTKLAGGFFLLLLSLKGDLDYYARTLRLRHYNANALCDLCPAERGGRLRALAYTNFGADAEWQRAPYTRQEWRALYHNKFLHWVFSLTHVSHFNLEPDELHA
eukprot:8398764-Pyramimonas_sp.AAC.1